MTRPSGRPTEIPEAYTEPFSKDYLLAPELEVCTYSGSNAVVAPDVYDALVDKVGEPLVGSVGGVRFSIRSHRPIPTDLIAISDSPKYAARDGDALLIYKNRQGWMVVPPQRRFPPL